MVIVMHGDSDAWLVMHGDGDDDEWVEGIGGRGTPIFTGECE